MRAATVVVTTATLMTLVACGGGPDVESLPSVASCAPATGQLGFPATLEGRAGAYHLVMVRSGSADAQTGAVGSLRLEERAPLGIDGWTTPLQGTADIELERVGAQRVGTLEATDPAGPGVLVLEWAGAIPRIILRFGSTANRTDRVAFDEAFTALTVRSIDDRGFAGTWRSGARDQFVNGHFCAVRLAG